MASIVKQHRSTRGYKRCDPDDRPLTESFDLRKNLAVARLPAIGSEIRGLLVWAETSHRYLTSPRASTYVEEVVLVSGLSPM